MIPSRSTVFNLTSLIARNNGSTEFGVSGLPFFSYLSKLLVYAMNYFFQEITGCVLYVQIQLINASECSQVHAKFSTICVIVIICIQLNNTVKTSNNTQ